MRLLLIFHFIMNYKNVAIIVAALAVGLVTGSMFQSGADDSFARGMWGSGMMNGGQRNNERDVNGQGMRGELNRGNCLADECLYVDNLEYPVGELTPSIKSALDAALEDEYKARSTYEAVIAKFGSVRPFAMIIGAEEQHIASLKSIYDKYGLTPPADKSVPSLAGISTLQDACQAGVDAEIANANLYKNELLPAVTGYEDITGVFTNLMNASEEKHLSAFERCN